MRFLDLFKSIGQIPRQEGLAATLVVFSLRLLKEQNEYEQYLQSVKFYGACKSILKYLGTVLFCFKQVLKWGKNFVCNS